jgi:hypothetical protein
MLQAPVVITCGVDIVENEDLYSLILKGPWFRESPFFIWRQNLVSIMNAVKNYVKRWAEGKKEELHTLSE